MRLKAIDSAFDEDWLGLRRALWPDTPDAEHRHEMEQFISAPKSYGQFLIFDHQGVPIGLAEASIRTDYVNGTDTSPVAFLEGLYVAPQSRRQGVARALLDAVRAWSLGRGCTELASDTQLDNTISQAVHARLGFRETERVVFFTMPLDSRSDEEPDPPSTRPAFAEGVSR